MKSLIKMLKPIGTLSICGFVLVMMYGCNWDCEHGIELRDDSFNFALLDKNTGEYLFKESKLTYHVDTFKIFDQNHVQLGEYDYDYFRDGSYGYRFSIIDIYDDTIDPDPQKQEVCKQYYLYLNYTDTDTLETCFTARRDGCLYFDRFEVFYNDALVFTENRESNIVAVSAEIPK